MLQRGSKIKLILKGDNTYEIISYNGEKIISANEPFYYYFKDVKFSKEGIECVYLGEFREASNNLLDKYCKVVKYNGEFTVDGKAVNSARMLAIENGVKTVIIIEEEE